MRIDRRFLGWGVFLVALGGVPLLVQLGALDSSTVAQLWRFWPVLLIAGGLAILLSRTALEGFGGILAAATLLCSADCSGRASVGSAMSAASDRAAARRSRALKAT